MGEQYLRVFEITLSLVSEGYLMGFTTVYVRLAGCDNACSFCEMPETQNRKSGHDYSVPRILAEIETLSQGKPMMVTLTGGNPCLPDCAELIRLGNEKGYWFALETQGSVLPPPSWLPMLSSLVVSPKPPSSGNTIPIENVESYLNVYNGDYMKPFCVKVPVGDDADLTYAMKVQATLPCGMPVYVQPVYPRTTIRVLAERVLALKSSCIVLLPQLHRIIGVK